MANPIKTSQLYENTGELKQLIAELEEVQKRLMELRNQEVKNAKVLEKAVRNVAVGTSEQREQLEQSAKQADEITKRYQKYNASLTTNGKKLAALKLAQQKVNQVNKLTAKLNASKEGSYNRLSAQYSLNKIRLNQMSAAERESTKEGRKLVKSTNDIYQEMKRLQEETGKNTLSVGDYGKALGPLGDKFNALSGQVKAFLANPMLITITLIVGAVTALGKSLQRSEEGQDRYNKVMRIASSVLDNVLDIVTELAIALFDGIPAALQKAGNTMSKFIVSIKTGFKEARLSVAQFLGETEKANELEKEIAGLNSEMGDLVKKGDELSERIGNAFDTVTNKAKNFRKEVNEDIIAAGKLADLEAQLNRAERKFLVENAKLVKQSTELRAKAEEVKKSAAEESLRALEKVFDLEEKAAANEVELVKLRANNLRQQSALANDDIAAKKEIAQADADVFAAESSLNQKRRERLKQLNTFRLEAFKQETDRKKNELEILKLLSSVEIDNNKEILKSSKELQEAKLRASNEIAEAERRLAKNKFEIERSELEKEYELKLKSEEDFNSELLLLNTRYETDLEKVKDGRKERDERINDEELKRIEDFNNEKLEKEKKFEELKAKLKSDFRKGVDDGFKQLQELKKSEFELLESSEEEKTRFVLNAEKERLQAIISLNKLFGKELTDVQLETIKNQIAKVDKEIAGLDAGGVNDIYDLFGFNIGDEKKEAIGEAIGFVKEQYGSLLEERLKLANQAVEAANNEVTQAQNSLQIERDKLLAGEANRAQSAARELERAEKDQEKALKTQEKAQKAKQRLDTLEQTGSLITASANIYKSFTGAGLGVAGPILAGAAIGLMFGNFIASKIKANKIVKKTFGKGTYEVLKGGSHMSGDDVGLGMMNEKTERRAEGGEGLAIFSKKNTKKYRNLLPDLVKSINTGTFEEMFMRKNMVGDDVGDFVLMGGSGGSVDMSRSEKLLEKIGKNTSGKVIINGRGRMVEMKGNLKTEYV